MQLSAKHEYLYNIGKIENKQSFVTYPVTKYKKWDLVKPPKTPEGQNLLSNKPAKANRYAISILARLYCAIAINPMQPWADIRSSMFSLVNNMIELHKKIINLYADYV